jgi:hypothetical protein
VDADALSAHLRGNDSHAALPAAPAEADVLSTYVRGSHIQMPAAQNRTGDINDTGTSTTPAATALYSGKCASLVGTGYDFAMACCALAVWMSRLAWRGVRALGLIAARLVGRRPAEREPAAG